MVFQSPPANYSAEEEEGGGGGGVKTTTRNNKLGRGVRCRFQSSEIS